MCWNVLVKPISYICFLLLLNMLIKCMRKGIKDWKLEAGCIYVYIWSFATVIKYRIHRGGDYPAWT